MDKKKIGFLSLIVLVFLLSVPNCASSEIQNVTAERTISMQELASNNILNIEVEITANSKVSAPALDEEVPDSWDVTPVENNGFTYKSSTNEWILLNSLNSGESKTIEYELKVPDDLQGEYLITGEISTADSGTYDIHGDTKISTDSGTTSSKSFKDINDSKPESNLKDSENNDEEVDENKESTGTDKSTAESDLNKSSQTENDEKPNESTPGFLGHMLIFVLLIVSGIIRREK